MGLETAENLIEPNQTFARRQPNCGTPSNINQDYVIKERSFFVVLDHYHLLTVNRNDRGFKADHISQIHAVEHIAHERNQGIPQVNYELRPGSLIDLIGTKYRELMGKRDRHCESERNDAWIRRSDEIAEINDCRPNSDTDRLYLGLSANLRSDKRHGLGTISSGGAYRHRGQINFSLSNGLDPASAIHHFRSYHGHEEVFIQIHTSLERMEWLHRELHSRPKANIGIRFRLAAHQKIAAAAPNDRDVFYVKRDTLTPITDVSIRVADSAWNGSGIVSARSH